MVNVRRLEEPQRVLAQREDLAIPEALRPFAQAKSGRVQPDRQGRADEPGARGVRHEAIHAPVLIALPVQQHEVLQTRWVEHLRDGRDDRVVVVIPARVHERRCLVVDEELIEGEAGLWRPDRNPVDPADHVVDPRTRHAWRLTESRCLGTEVGHQRTSTDEFGEPGRS